MLIYSQNVTETGTVTAEPVTLAYAKNHLRVDITDDDALITNLITAAREYIEVYCARSIVQHTYRADLPGFYDVMQLPLGPVQSISSIKYYDTASPSVLQTLSSSVYSLQKDCVYKNEGASWESVANRPDAVQITYMAGYSDLASPEDTVGNTPQAISVALLLLVGDYYENREGQSGSRQLVENPTVMTLLNTYRQYR
ncbi:head-tail connector protein [bacterium]|nr:head-tail connector protein [bacterium]